jgi:uncharacterized membrane protein
MLKFASWDVWAASAIAVLAVLALLIFDQSPLLFFLIFVALCAYIVVQTLYSERK